MLQFFIKMFGRKRNWQIWCVSYYHIIPFPLWYVQNISLHLNSLAVIFVLKYIYTCIYLVSSSNWFLQFDLDYTWVLLNFKLKRWNKRENKNNYKDSLPAFLLWNIRDTFGIWEISKIHLGFGNLFQPPSSCEMSEIHLGFGNCLEHLLVFPPPEFHPSSFGLDSIKTLYVT